MSPICPKCGSHIVITLEHEGVSYLQCRICHYDELEQDIVPEEHSSQKAKKEYSPYKQGGEGKGKEEVILLQQSIYSSFVSF